MAQPVPDRRPNRSGGTRCGIMALLNTAATSTATVPTAKPTSATATACGAPGAACQRTQDETKSTAPQAAIQGFFGPVASAIEPRTGDRTASASPAAAVAKPQR